jgi:hypothetical protein
MAHNVERNGKSYRVDGANSQGDAERAVGDAENRSTDAKVLWCIIVGLFGAFDFYVLGYIALIPVSALLHNVFRLNFALKLALPLIPAVIGFRIFFLRAFVSKYVFVVVLSIIAGICMPIWFKDMGKQASVSYEVVSDGAVFYDSASILFQKIDETKPLPLPKGSVVQPLSGKLRNKGYTQVNIHYYNGEIPPKITNEKTIDRTSAFVNVKDADKLTQIEASGFSSVPLYDKPDGKILIESIPLNEPQISQKTFKILEKQEGWQKICLINEAESFQPKRDFYWVRANVPDKEATVAITSKDKQLMEKAKFGAKRIGDSIPVGTRLKITGKIKSKTFVPVEYKGVKGWLLRNGEVYLTKGEL